MFFFIFKLIKKIKFKFFLIFLFEIYQVFAPKKIYFFFHEFKVNFWKNSYLFNTPYKSCTPCKSILQHSKHTNPYLVIAPDPSIYLFIAVVNKYFFFLIFKTETNISNSHLIHTTYFTVQSFYIGTSKLICK